jgi:lysophospholipase L1-like esterase
MAQMTPLLNAPEDTAHFNSNVWAIVAKSFNSGKKTLEVQGTSALGAEDVGSDGVHPRDSGYRKMAQAWYIGWHQARDWKWIP